MSPRTADKNKEIRKESMKKIMDAAFSLIAKKGYEGTSVAEIAEEAGVSKGLLYNYFKSKQHLVEELISQAASEGDEVISKLTTDDPATTLENIFKYLFRELKERTQYFRILTELTFKMDQFEFMHNLASEKYKGYQQYTKSLLTQLGIPDPDGESKMLSALFDGIGIQYLVLRENYPMDDLEKFLIKKYCRKNKTT